MKRDEFAIYERLLQKVNKEIADDQMGIQRNLETIRSMENTNSWLARRIQDNVKVHQLLTEAQSQ